MTMVVRAVGRKRSRWPERAKEGLTCTGHTPRPPSAIPMSDIRGFFNKPQSTVKALEASAPVFKRTPHEKEEKPKAKVARTTPLLKTLVVKNERETQGFVGKPEYRSHRKYVIATHRSIRIRTADTTTYTVKQRGQIDAEMGAEDEALGCDELLALPDAAQMIAELLVESDEDRLVVIAHKKKGAHGAYLLGKIAWNMVCRQKRSLSDATKVGEPGKWLYSELWKGVKTVKPDKLPGALEEWYHSHP